MADDVKSVARRWRMFLARSSFTSEGCLSKSSSKASRKRVTSRIAALCDFSQCVHGRSALGLDRVGSLRRVGSLLLDCGTGLK